MPGWSSGKGAAVLIADLAISSWHSIPELFTNLNSVGAPFLPNKARKAPFFRAEMDSVAGGARNCSKN